MKSLTPVTSLPVKLQNVKPDVTFCRVQVLYLIGCTVSVERDAHLVVALVLAGQGYARTQRNLGEKKENPG